MPEDEPKIYATPDVRPPQREGLRAVVSTVALLMLAPIIALTLTTFVFQSYEVDGPSMQTTLQNQDRLIVIKLPRSWSRITRHPYIPKRADIVIFNHPDSVGDFTGTNKQLIKRVIGLPGERVVVKNNQLTLYTAEHPEGYQPDKVLPYGKVITGTTGEIDVVVPENEIFVSGDNRDNSLDSRYFGTVPVSDVVGKLGIRIYPFNQAKIF